MGLSKESALALSIYAASGVATAGPVSLYELSKLEDDSAESIYFDANKDRKLDVGDTLRGIIKFPQIVDELDNTHVTLQSGLELTGLFEVQVLTKTFAGSATGIGNLYTFTFGQGTNVTLDTDYGLSAGAAIALWADSTPDFALGGTNCTTVGLGNDCENNASDGSLWMVYGFGQDSDEFWGTGPAPEDTSVFANFKTTQALGGFNYQLSILENYSGYSFKQVGVNTLVGGDGMIDILGNGAVYGKKNALGSAVTPHSLTNDADITLYRVPEPTSIALMGLGLLGVGAAARRKKQA